VAWWPDERWLAAGQRAVLAGLAPNTERIYPTGNYPALQDYGSVQGAHPTSTACGWLVRAWWGCSWSWRI